MKDKHFNPPAMDALSITVSAAQYRHPLFAVAIPGKGGARTGWYCSECVYRTFSSIYADLDYFSQNLRWAPCSREALFAKMTVANGRDPYIHRVSCVPVHACRGPDCPTRRPRSNAERDTPDWAAKPIHKR